MKRIILTLVMTSILLAVSLMGFGQQNKKVEKNNINAAEKEAKVTKEDSISDCQDFIKKSKERLAINQKKIADLKDASKKVKEKNDKNILALEQKNNDLKERIEKCSNTNAWESFKIKFSREMDTLEAYINIDVNTLIKVKQ